jgi:hypothetical protein
MPATGADLVIPLLRRLARSLLVVALAWVPALAAQEYEFKPAVQWQGRLDVATSGRGTAALGGVGVNVPAGYYVRVGVEGSVGATSASGGLEAAARLELSTRFLFDPFAEQRVGWYAGGGLASVRDGTAWRPYLTLLVGREGPTAGRWRSAVEAGVGGGVRIGVVLRRARVNGR